MSISYFALSAMALLNFWILFSSRHFWKGLFFTALGGMAAFFAANFVGSFIHVHLPLQSFSLSCALLGGAPAVIGLLFLQAIFAAL